MTQKNDKEQKQIRTSEDYFKQVYGPKHNISKQDQMNPKQKKDFNDKWKAYKKDHGLGKAGSSTSAAFHKATGSSRLLGDMFSHGMNNLHDKHLSKKEDKLKHTPLSGHEYDDYIKASNESSSNAKVSHLLSLIRQFNQCKDPKKANDVYAKRIDQYAVQSHDPKVIAVHDKMARKATRAASENTKWGKQHIGVVMENMDLASGPIKKHAINIEQNKAPNKSKQDNEENAADEDYVNKASMNPFWSKKLHKPIVNLDAKHRADVNPKSPYAGKHIMTYVSKDGQMIHTQVISGNDFNRIRALNHQKPFSMKAFMHHMKNHIPLATAASNLAFRAKTFVHKGLRKVRGKATRFIQTASIKAANYKFRWQREAQAEQQVHMIRDRQRRLMLAKGAKHPYDAFDIVSPRELKQMLGSDPRNYTFKQDYVNAQNPRSAFNYDTPNMKDLRHESGWREGCSQNDLRTYQRIVHPDTQQSSSYAPKRNQQAQDDGPDL